MLVLVVKYWVVTSVSVYVTLMVYPMMTPLCSSSGGGSQLMTMENGDVALAMMDCGYPLGTIGIDSIKSYVNIKLSKMITMFAHTTFRHGDNHWRVVRAHTYSVCCNRDVICKGRYKRANDCCSPCLSNFHCSRNRVSDTDPIFTYDSILVLISRGYPLQCYC